MDHTDETFQKLKEIGYEPLGSFYCGGELVIGDPSYLNVDSRPGEPSLLQLPAKNGLWHAFAKREEMADPIFDQVIVELIVCHQGEIESLPNAIEMMNEHGLVESESGQVCFTDATRRHEEGLDDDFMFIEGDAALVRDVGVSTSVEGDGSYPLFTDSNKPHSIFSLTTWKEGTEIAAENS